MGLEFGKFAVDIIKEGKDVLGKGIDYITHGAVSPATDKKDDDIKERQKIETLRDKIDIQRQERMNQNRLEMALKEKELNRSDRAITYQNAKIETFFETKIELRDVDHSKEQNIDNVGKKSILDRLHDVFRKITGKEFVVNEGKSKNYLLAKNAMDDYDSFKNLSPGQKDRLCKLYEAHPSKENLRLFKNLARDNRLDESVIAGLEKIDDPNLKLAKGIDRNNLFNTALSDISDPSTINQKHKGTCAATAVQIALASKNPGRYLEILGLLASESGDASSITPGLVRTDQSPINDTKDPRSITVKIMSPAFMEYADGPNLTYNNADNYHYNDKGIKDHKGLYQSETARLYDGVMNEDKTETIYVHDSNRDEQYKKIKNAVADGRPIPVGLNWYKTIKRKPDEIEKIYRETGIRDIAYRKKGGHEVLLERIARDPEDGKIYAYIINPWGEINRMPEEEFKQSIHAATIPKTISKIGEAARQNDPRRASLIDIVK
ncbi:MAG: hypothetical protein J7M18_08630 [Candidatus Eremiobacteraeota bacterium]|nr:hypothetical protein [Candidatus Eremiobacteraeota bacterium]